MPAYVIVNGQRVAPGVAGALRRMNYDYMKAHNGEFLLLTSGVRTWDQQMRLHRIYLNGGTLALHPNNPLAFHVETNPVGQRAIDIRDSGADPGVTTFGEPEAEWIRANCHKYGFKAAGYTFSQVEPWHLEYQLDPWKVEGWMKLPTDVAQVPSKPKPKPTLTTQETNMIAVDYKGHKFAIGEEQIKHFVKGDAFDFFMRVHHNPDRWVATDDEKEFNALLDGAGIPRNVVRASDGAVLNPEANGGKGAFEADGFWSRARVILATIK